jgi:hypothetical protein
MLASGSFVVGELTEVRRLEWWMKGGVIWKNDFQEKICALEERLTSQQIPVPRVPTSWHCPPGLRNCSSWDGSRGGVTPEKR